jgi:5-methylcytosine-specific restriction endonuclease McrA
LNWKGGVSLNKREYNATYHAAHGEEIRSRKRAAYYVDLELTRAKKRDVQSRYLCTAKGRMQNRKASAARRAIKHGNGSEPVDLEAIIQRDGSRCHICRRRVKRADLVFDHLIPIIHGGPHKASNLAVAHRRCNARRGAGRLPAQLFLEVAA